MAPRQIAQQLMGQANGYRDGFFIDTRENPRRGGNTLVEHQVRQQDLLEGVELEGVELERIELERVELERVELKGGVGHDRDSAQNKRLIDHK